MKKSKEEKVPEIDQMEVCDHAKKHRDLRAASRRYEMMIEIDGVDSPSRGHGGPQPEIRQGFPRS